MPRTKAPIERVQVTLMLDAETVKMLDAIARDDGDGNKSASVRRLIRKEFAKLEKSQQ